MPTPPNNPRNALLDECFDEARGFCVDLYGERRTRCLQIERDICSNHVQRKWNNALTAARELIKHRRDNRVHVR